MLSIAMTVSLIVGPGALGGMPSGEVQQFFEAVCGKGNVLTRQEKQSPAMNVMQAGWGCKKCPPYTSDAGMDMSPAASDPVLGAFAAAGRTEALVDLFGCEPHANLNGGTALLRKEQGLWKRISYEGGLRTSACLTFRRSDGTDLFVCESGGVFQGEVFSGLNVHRYTNRGTIDQRDALFDAQDNLNACSREGNHIAMVIQKIDARDTNSDGRKDLAVDVSAAFARVKTSENNPCLTEEEQKKYLKPKQYHLVYLFDGNSLAASPETRKTLRELDAARSDILGEPIDEQSARGLVEHWLRTSEDNGKLRDVMWNYADVVDFYTFGPVEKNIVQQDKQKYYSRWPKRKYELKSFALAPGERRHEAKVVITFAYEISNEKKSLKGEAKSVLTLQSSDEGIRIVGERE
jgi:hypothetical protein